MQERFGQQELAFARLWQLRGGCDVSHFRMDSTMCGMPPSFFLFFLSCQMNACSLGYRTEEVIHQKWCKRMHDSDFFFSAHHGLFVCHSSGPQIEGFGEQCKISTAKRKNASMLLIWCNSSHIKPQTFTLIHIITPVCVNQSIHAPCWPFLRSHLPRSTFQKQGQIVLPLLHFLPEVWYF